MEFACQQDLKDVDSAPPALITSPITGVSSQISATPAASSETTQPASATDPIVIGDEASDNTYRNILFGLLFIGVAGAVFLWLRGSQWVRRLLSGKDRAHYSMVAEDDVEK